MLTGYAARPDSNRANAYMAPGGYNQLLTGLNVFGSFLCTSNPLPTIGSSLSQSTTSVTGTVLTLAQLVEKYYFTPTPGGPPCKAQPPLGRRPRARIKPFPISNHFREHRPHARRSSPMTTPIQRRKSLRRIV